MGRSPSSIGARLKTGSILQEYTLEEYLRK
jgi:hypothetical protein